LELEKKTNEPQFWENKEEASKTLKEISLIKEDLADFENLTNKLKEIEELSSLDLEKENLEPELAKECFLFSQALTLKENEVFLSGPYDKEDAILQIFAGAGGQDAQDWARMLLRMYQRYAQRRGWHLNIISQSFGSGVWLGEPGIKEATLEVKGKFAYGYLKGEAGVHRLVRISPFSPQNLRHTSFARVEVFPAAVKESDLKIKINPSDLKFETFKASGPGGQYVNKRESAVRLTHLPTGLTVSVQTERLLGQNKEKALKILYSKLYEMEIEKNKKESKKLETGILGSWGYQKRSYVLNPYKLVKDLKTGVETTDVWSVLDGSLEKFIEAQIRTQ
jgi:peptide chain release factor 2